jgi:hypothetical protein
LVNRLQDRAIQRTFAADPIVTPVLPMIAVERFAD